MEVTLPPGSLEPSGRNVLEVIAAAGVAPSDYVYVHDVRVAYERALNPGDVIRLGRTGGAELSFQLGSSSAAISIPINASMSVPSQTGSRASHGAASWRST